MKELYEEFSEPINGIYNTCCSVRKMEGKKLDLNFPYISNEIKNLIKEKHKLQKKV